MPQAFGEMSRSNESNPIRLAKLGVTAQRKQAEIACMRVPVLYILPQNLRVLMG